MTKSYTFKQIYDLSVNGNINHRKFSFLKFKNFCNEYFEDPKHNSIVIDILLPDGWWYCAIMRMKNNNETIWDYYIPDTREQQKEMYGELEKELESRGKHIYDI